MTGDGDRHEPDVLLASTGGAADLMRDALRDIGGVGVVTVDPEDVVHLEFREEADRWLVRTRGGQEYRPRLVIGNTGRPPVECVGAGLAPYRGVAWSGCFNYFTSGKPTRPDQARFIAECVSLMYAQNATRIGVRAGAQRAYCNEYPVRNKGIRRRMRKRSQSYVRDFDLSSLDEREPDALYEGMAELVRGELRRTVQVFLNGHFEPLDGRYHWYGRVHDDVRDFARPNREPLMLSVAGGAQTQAHLEECDPWGHARIAGVGAPPFTLDPVEV